MQFILNHKKYSILNHELYINYIIVDSYFRDYSKYEYNIHFDFLDSLLTKSKIEFGDIVEGAGDLEELIEKNKINFIPQGLIIDEDSDGTFTIFYQTMKFRKINVGEAIPFLIALNSLLNAKPTISLFQIEEELTHFLEKFRSYQS